MSFRCVRLWVSFAVMYLADRSAHDYHRYATYQAKRFQHLYIRPNDLLSQSSMIGTKILVDNVRD